MKRWVFTFIFVSFALGFHASANVKCEPLFAERPEPAIDFPNSKLKLKPLIAKSTRYASIRELLNSRLNQETERVELENSLLDLGYGKGKSRFQFATEFRDKHAFNLSLIRIVAKNVASSVLLGAPFLLKSNPPRNFRRPKVDRDNWMQLRREFQGRINRNDPLLVREIKIEAAVELASRIAAIAIFALLTDELLDNWPEWQSLKVKILSRFTWGDFGIESHIELERIAFENWKDITEAFTSERPADDSPEAIEILTKIRATTREDLWLHIHHQRPLSEPAIEEADRMNLDTNFGL